MCEMEAGGGKPLLTIAIMAGGKPMMPPGHEMHEPMEMGGEDMDMMPEPKAPTSPRPMSAMKGLKPKREFGAPRGMR